MLTAEQITTLWVRAYPQKSPNNPVPMAFAVAIEQQVAKHCANQAVHVGSFGTHDKWFDCADKVASVIRKEYGIEVIG